MSDERLDPEAAPEPSLQEHLARYLFARERVRGRILDVACGAGYGTSLLGAVGLDLSADALRAARRCFVERRPPAGEFTGFEPVNRGGGFDDGGAQA